MTMQDRKRKSKELHTQVDDKQQQLERYYLTKLCVHSILKSVCHGITEFKAVLCKHRLNVQEASLMRAKRDQEALIAKLTDSTAHNSD